MKVIRICYRKIIDAASTVAWDKLVFDSSYTEFRMQVQFFNPEKKYTSFAELLLNNPSADKLHFLVSGAVTGYIQQLGGKMPGVLDNLGRHFLSFTHYRFEIINSDTEKKENHQAAINFFSEPQQLIDTIGNYMVIAPVNAPMNEDGLQTHTLEMKPFLSICAFKDEN